MADTNAEPWEIPVATDGQLHGLTLIEVLARRVEVVALRRGMALVAAVERSIGRYLPVLCVRPARAASEAEASS